MLTKARGGSTRTKRQLIVNCHFLTQRRRHSPCNTSSVPFLPNTSSTSSALSTHLTVSLCELTSPLSAADDDDETHGAEIGRFLAAGRREARKLCTVVCLAKLMAAGPGCLDQGHADCLVWSTYGSGYASAAVVHKAAFDSAAAWSGFVPRILLPFVSKAMPPRSGLFSGRCFASVHHKYRFCILLLFVVCLHGPSAICAHTADSGLSFPLPRLPRLCYHPRGWAHPSHRVWTEHHGMEPGTEGNVAAFI